MIRNLTLLFSLLLTTMSFAADPAKVFEARAFQPEADGPKLNYRLMSPIEYDRTKQYPLVVFLHGAGERGDDNTKQLVHGMADFASDENRLKYPAFVLAPQCPNDKRWVEVDWGALKHDMPEKPSQPMGLLFQLLDAMPKQLAIDPNRIYITGLSMGGYGTWDAIQRRPDYFAAAIPICGGGDLAGAEKMKNIPIWAFHGDQDGAVKVSRSRDMIKAIEAAGGKPKYTEYPGVGHDSWTATYKNPEVLQWLFEQKKGK
jgi:predicted peptidase